VAAKKRRGDGRLGAAELELRERRGERHLPGIGDQVWGYDEQIERVIR
jgi:hypothetical protein